MSVTQGDNRQASQEKQQILKMTSKKMREFQVGGNKHQSGFSKIKKDWLKVCKVI